MPRPTCLEDGFEYRVKLIFNRLRQDHKDEETDVPFPKWIEKNHKAVGVAFLNDVETYMGMPLDEGEKAE